MKPIELRGVITEIGELQQKTPKFSVLKFYLDVGDDKFPNVLPIDVIGGNEDCLDQFGIGSPVIVQVYPKGWSGGINLRLAGIQPAQTEERQYKPRKEPEPELPLPDQPNYASGEVIPFGRTAGKHEDANAEDVLGKQEIPDDLPFVWLLIAGLTGIGTLAQILPNF